MRAIVPAEGVRLLRPLLGITRATIIGYLESLGQDWLEDPSNRSARFERIRWRQGQLGALPEMVVIQANQVADMLNVVGVAQVLSAVAWQADQVEEKMARTDSL